MTPLDNPSGCLCVGRRRPGFVARLLLALRITCRRRAQLNTTTL